MYTLASWASVSSYGPGNQAFDALTAGATNVFGGELAVDYLNYNVVPANELIGTWLGQLMSVFIITGAFACAAALNNAGLRYTYALGREGLLPRALGRTHAKHKTPHVAVITQAVIALAIILIFRFADRAPLDVYYWIAVQGVIWIILVQALTSLSVWAYFRKLPAGERSFWKTTVAAWIGFLAQILVLYLCYKYLSALAAGDVLYVKELGQIGPWGLRLGFEIDITWLGIIGVIVPVAALIYALFLRSAQPDKYERRAGSSTRETSPKQRRRRGRSGHPLLQVAAASSAYRSCASRGSPGSSTPSSAAVPMVNAQTPRSSSARIRSAESTDPAAITGSDVAETTVSTRASTSPS